MADRKDEETGFPTYSAVTQALIGCLVASPLAVYYYYHGDTGRGLVTLVAGVVLAFIISAQWSLRRLGWFWWAIAVAVGVNVALIALIPWPNGRGIKGPVLAPFGLALGGLDYLVIWSFKRLRRTEVNGTSI